ncbi:MAG: PAS domain S-box protein [Armatimonadota bacterium]
MDKLTSNTSGAPGGDSPTSPAALTAGILQAALDCIIVIDAESRVLEWNAAAESVFGYTRGEAVGRKIADLVIPPPLHEAHYAGMARYLAQGIGPILNQRIEVMAVRRGGDEFPVELAVVPIEETPPRFAAYLRDITARKASEAALLQSEQRFRSLVDATSQIVWVRTPDGNFETDQPQWSRFTGESFDKIRGRDWLSSIHPDDRDRVAGEWNEAVRTNRHYNIEYRIRRSDGVYREMSVRGVPVFHEDGVTVREWVGVSTDITPQKEAEAWLQARLRQQEAVAHIGVHALSGIGLEDLMAEATRAVAAALEVELCKVLQYLPGEQKLLPVAGFGWEGLSGRDKIAAGTASQGGYTLLTGDWVVVDDLRTETRFSGQPLLRDHGVVSGLSCLIPGGAGRGPWGVILAHTKTRRLFGHDDTHFLQSVANVLATAVERVLAAQALAQSELQRHGILQDVLSSVTEGRLLLCADATELPQKREKKIGSIPLGRESLRAARVVSTEGASAIHLSQDRINDLLTAVGEATMNAVTHAGGGHATVFIDESAGVVQVWVEDTGNGIAMNLLPKATLRPGYTTTGTLGHGLKLILQTADRLWLLTGATGTTAVLEVGREAPPLGWLAALS